MPTSTISTNFPDLKSIGTLLKVVPSNNDQLYPVFNEDFYIDITQISGYLNITNIRLSGKGFVFVGLENILFDLSK